MTRQMCLALAGTLALTASARAAIDSGTAGPGDTFLQISPPTNVGNNNQNTNDTLFAFDEKQKQVLTSGLTLDLPAATSPTVLPAGTIISSHYVFVDPSGSRNNVVGTVTFDNPILGIIFEDINLDASNFLGAIGTTYASPSLLGLEGGDLVAISGTNTVSIDFTAGSPGDYIRVITEDIPEPATASLLALGLLSMSRRR
ncbi:hypothetical protein [Mucisphaera sp.]|uniref:hypothetical protein n=1 Tax=Mucisphaera sp. TaxID=2913024 RepID=UPI003D0E5E2E